MSKEALEKTRKRLLEIVSKLEWSYEQAQSLLPAFERMTTETASKLRRHGPAHCQGYLKSWFRTFLGIKDECMILITGELVRSYHKSFHADFCHEREEESRIYKSGCALSACSVDGLDFEYRRATARFGNRSSLSAIADRSDVISGGLNDLSKDIDGLTAAVKKALLDVGASFVKLELLHCGEVCEVRFPDSSLAFTLSSSSLRRCSRAEALYMVVEDPKNFPLSMSVNEKSRKEGESPRRRKKRLFLDDSDEEVAVKTEIEEPDFALSVSIEEIKRAYGHHSRDGPPPTNNEGNCEEIAESSTDNKQKSSEQEPSSSAISFSSREFDAVDGLPAPSSHKLKFKVWHPLSTGIVGETDRQRQSFVVINVDVLCPSVFFAAQTSQDRPRISSDAVLDEITVALWQSMLKPLDPSKAPLWHFWFPQSAQIEGKMYRRGTNELLPLPSVDKVYPVQCVHHDRSLNISTALITYCMENGPMDALMRKAIFYKRLVLLAANHTTMLKMIHHDSQKNKIEFNFLKNNLDESFNEISRELNCFLAKTVCSEGVEIRIDEFTEMEAKFWFGIQWFSRLDFSHSSFSLPALVQCRPTQIQSYRLKEFNLNYCALFAHLRLPCSSWVLSLQRSFVDPSDLNSLRLTSKETQLSDAVRASLCWDTVIESMAVTLTSTGEPLTALLHILICETPLEILDMSGCISCIFDALVLSAALLQALRARKSIRQDVFSVRINGLQEQWPNLCQFVNETVERENLLVHPSSKLHL